MYELNCELGKLKHKNDVILIKLLSQILFVRYNFFENDVNRLLYKISLKCNCKPAFT